MAAPITTIAPDPTALLRHHGLRVTDSRVQVLATFLMRGHALAHPELEAVIDSCDRVTLYRTLQTFVDKGLLHQVPDAGGATKYALCQDACAEHHHHDNHVHFSCSRCGQTRCLAEVVIPAFELPTGYRGADRQLLVQGLCPLCA
jgi:Fur family transcriptional regulator, ferric uptake regulator